MKKQFTKLLILIFIFGLFPINFSSAQNLSDKLSGKILLQVESVGQAWYIDTETKERAFLGRPADAFRIMRELGLGISEDSYDSFNGYAPSRLSGKILLRVEANGEAYYVFPDDLKMYYLGRPSDAFRIMREKGLGITDEDLNKVPVFEKYKEQVEENTDAIDELTKKLEEQQNKIDELEEKLNTDTSTYTSTDSCTVDTWVCGAWNECSSAEQQTRTCTLSLDCGNVNTPSPSISQNCNYTSNNTCTSWTYSDWSTCSTSEQQTRSVVSSSPNGCTGGSPATTQFCIPQPQESPTETKSNSETNTDTIIENHCQSEWPNDAEMKVYCKEQQYNGLTTLNFGRPSDMTESQFSTIGNRCKSEWPADFEMRAYCEDQQYNGVRTLNNGKPTDIGDTEFGIIRPKCEHEWPIDFEMRAYCESQQYDAVRTLNQGKPVNVSESDFESARLSCANEWPTDYEMRVYCENQEY